MAVPGLSRLRSFVVFKRLKYPVYFLNYEFNGFNIIILKWMVCSLQDIFLIGLTARVVPKGY